MSVRDGLARSVQVRLARHAREIGVDPNLMLTRYGGERFLYRLSLSPHAERFVLKGALLMLAWLGEALRPTRDIDLLGYGDLPDEALLSIVRDVCEMTVEPDAVEFLPDSASVTAIREDDAYGGRRVVLQALLGAARLSIQLDIGIGDAVTPDPDWIEYPGLLDAPRARLRAYPRETVVAEKLHAMVLLGMRNSRMKDYFDVHALLREDAMDANSLVSAIAATFTRRRTQVPVGIPSGLSDDFALDTAKRSQWEGFIKRNRIDAPSLDELVVEIRDRLLASINKARLLETGSA